VYLWVKALHVAFMVTWFAGLFYLPRLYVYHAEASDRAGLESFKVMERRLYYGIMGPGAALTAVFGLWLIGLRGLDWFLASTWLHVKLVLISLLLVYHAYLGHLRRQFAMDANRHSATFYRWLNEAPVLVLVAAVVLAEVKPWS
jgi:protoporphyrinogen IX oxidase